MGEDEQEEYRISCTLGDLTLTVRGNDEEWVAEQFEDEWEQRLDEASEMKDAIRSADPHAH